MSFVPLDRNILDSTIWRLDPVTCKVWITMLAMAHHRSGIVEATAPGIASRASLTADEVAHALAVLESPDRYSKSTAEQGRRILRVEGGYRIVNHSAYQNKDHSTPRVKRFRARKSEMKRNETVPTVTETKNKDKEKDKEKDKKREEELPARAEVGMNPNPDACHIAKRWYAVAPRGTCALDKASHQFARGLLCGIDKHALMAAVEKNPGRLPYEIVDALKPSMNKTSTAAHPAYRPTPIWKAGEHD